MKKTREQVLRDNAFRLTSLYEPSRVTKTRKTKGKAAAKKMATAIALDEARRLGVKIPRG